MLTGTLKGARVLVRRGSTDMRKRINGLAVEAEQELEAEPFSHAVLLICNRERRIRKALHRDHTGFTVCAKWPEKHQYPWPSTPVSSGGRPTNRLSGFAVTFCIERLMGKTLER